MTNDFPVGKYVFSVSALALAFARPHHTGCIKALDQPSPIESTVSSLILLSPTTDILLTAHCHREGEDIGLYVRIVDFSDDQWRTIEETKVWGNAPSMKVAAYSTMGQNLRFGQASLRRRSWR